MPHYSFITTWKFQSSVKLIWPIIKEMESWPSWWKGIVAVNIINPGFENGLGKKASMTWKSKLPYCLSLISEVTEVHEFYRITGRTYGELEGTGIWEFEQVQQVSILKFFWEVKTTKRWMNIMAPVLGPAFKWNHDVLMKWGYDGLSEKLNRIPSEFTVE